MPVASDPGLLGLPAFIVGTVALALVQIGVVPIGTTGASLPILLTATSAGLFLATYWAASAGQSMVAGVYGIFGGFYLSYAALVLGLIHNWFGITLPAVVATQKVFGNPPGDQAQAAAQQDPPDGVGEPVRAKVRAAPAHHQRRGHHRGSRPPAADPDGRDALPPGGGEITVGTCPRVTRLTSETLCPARGSHARD